MRKWIVLIVIVVIVAAAGGWYLRHSRGDGVVFRTVPVERGDITATISATGTLEPEEVVDVGAQLSGTLDYFGKDIHKSGKLVDYGSEVDEGEVLAHIDDSLYAANVASAQAQVEQARANVQKAKADLAQDKAKLFQAANDWKRAQSAGVNAGLSQSDIDQYQANYDVAVANVADGQAAILQAQTGQAQYEAALEYAKKNLSYCTIVSPVKGTIIDRRVNIGQTVASAMSTPSLFLVAKDLKRIQVWASVNEADIGNIHPGQAVTFTVDAYPGRTFQAEVGQVRLNASMTQNVVTYTVEVNTDNLDGKLLPYMTANLLFQLDHHSNVLLVPNSALRWTPTEDEVAPDVRQAQADSAESPEPPPTTRPINESAAHQHGSVWIKDGQYVRPLRVKIGLTDGLNSEIESDQLDEGKLVVVGEVEAGAEGGARNPFLPQFGGRRRQ